MARAESSLAGRRQLTPSPPMTACVAELHSFLCLCRCTASLPAAALRRASGDLVIPPCSRDARCGARGISSQPSQPRARLGSRLKRDKAGATSVHSCRTSEATFMALPTPPQSPQQQPGRSPTPSACATIFTFAPALAPRGGCSHKASSTATKSTSQSDFASPSRENSPTTPTPSRGPSDFLLRSTSRRTCSLDLSPFGPLEQGAISDVLACSLSAVGDPSSNDTERDLAPFAADEDLAPATPQRLAHEDERRGRHLVPMYRAFDDRTSPRSRTPKAPRPSSTGRGCSQRILRKCDPWLVLFPFAPVLSRH